MYHNNYGFKGLFLLTFWQIKQVIGIKIGNTMQNIKFYSNNPLYYVNNANILTKVTYKYCVQNAESDYDALPK